MYPYKAELLSSLRAFVMAWTILLVPIMGFAYVNHWVNPPAIER